MSVRKISENKYRAYATTEKCEVETNIPFGVIKELQKRTDIDRNYPDMWSMAPTILLHQFPYKCHQHR